MGPTPELKKEKSVNDIDNLLKSKSNISLNHYRSHNVKEFIDENISGYIDEEQILNYQDSHS